VLGKHSGRHALRERLASLGHEFDEAQTDEIFARFKTLADKKKEIYDSDLDALALGLDPEAVGPWKLQHLHATTHLGNGASASVRLVHRDGRRCAEAALGDGPVHAVLRAIARAAGVALDIDDFQIRSLSNGADAQGRAAISVRHNGRELHGRGVSTDIVEAAAQAALEIINRIERLHQGQDMPLAANQA
jgi:2-isopropylmalate synthase